MGAVHDSHLSKAATNSTDMDQTLKSGVHQYGIAFMLKSHTLSFLHWFVVLDILSCETEVAHSALEWLGGLSSYETNHHM